MNAGCAGGSSRGPVLFGEVLMEWAASQDPPEFFVPRNRRWFLDL